MYSNGGLLYKNLNKKRCEKHKLYVKLVQNQHKI